MDSYAPGQHGWQFLNPTITCPLVYSNGSVSYSSIHEGMLISNAGSGSPESSRLLPCPPSFLGEPGGELKTPNRPLRLRFGLLLEDEAAWIAPLEHDNDSIISFLYNNPQIHGTDLSTTVLYTLVMGK